MPDSEQDEKNRALMKSLRESFEPIAQRLTPDVEPATIYTPSEPSPDAEQ